MPLSKIANTIGLMAALVSFSSLGHAEPHIPPYGLVGLNHPTGQAVVVFQPNPVGLSLEGSSKWMPPATARSIAKRLHALKATFHLLVIRAGIEKSRIHHARNLAPVFDQHIVEDAEHNLAALTAMMVVYSEPKEVYVPPWVAMMEKPQAMIPTANALANCTAFGVTAPEDVTDIPVNVSCEPGEQNPFDMELVLTRADGLSIAYGGSSTVAHILSPPRPVQAR